MRSARLLPAETRSYSNSVFINCPFEPSYAGQFRAIVYTVIRLGLIPRCSLESDLSSSARLARIIGLVRECRYGIHDISMQSLDATTGLPRFNMPFELGLFIGCKNYHPEQESKSFLVLDSDAYRFRNSISDLAGYDVEAHQNSPPETIRQVRDWLSKALDVRLYGAVKLQDEYREFEALLPEIARELASDADRITFPDLCHLMQDWVLEAFGPGQLQPPAQ